MQPFNGCLKVHLNLDRNEQSRAPKKNCLQNYPPIQRLDWSLDNAPLATRTLSIPARIVHCMKLQLAHAIVR